MGRIKDMEFVDSAEATDFMEKLDGMLNDPRLLNWVQVTDANYGTNTSISLDEAQSAYGALLDTMYHAA